MARKRILVVDDEDDVRAVAQIALEMVGGWGVIAAVSGEDGVALAARERPDAILLDVMMPGLDGPATLRRLRADPATASIPVLLLTGKAETDRRSLDALGADGVLAKPFDPMELASQVSAALGWPE